MHDSGKRVFWTSLFCMGILQTAVYYAVALAAGGGDALAAPQPDTLLYCQAARRIAEGHPFSFSCGTAVSSGTTSHLYPFLLAVPYWLGATGEALLAAGFLLNMFFYLLFLWGWGMVLDALVRTPGARLFGGVLLAGFGHAALSAFAQSDVGLWMAASAFLAAGFARREARIYGPLLALGPWMRPEGMLCVLSFAACAVTRGVVERWMPKGRSSSVRRADWMWATLGVASVAGVFAFNFVLTGMCQFSSVAHKGHFHDAGSFAAGLVRTACDFAVIVKAYVLGLPQSPSRDFVFLPVLCAALAGLGVATFTWKRRGNWRLAAWLLAVLGGLATVASSGWQDTNFDRYFAWLLPTILVAATLGVERLHARRNTRAFASLAGGSVLLWTFGGAVVSYANFAAASRQMAPVPTFARLCDQTMRPKAAVGTNGHPGMAYFFSDDRRVVNLSGIYSPELFDGEWPVGQFEILKNEPTTRFDYWLVEAAKLERELGFKLEETCGRQMLVGPDGFELMQADWSRLTAAAQSAPPPGTAWTLAARVDVGYAKDERAAAYEILPRYAHVDFLPFLVKGKLGGTPILEGGRLVVGQDEMTVPTHPGRDLVVVLRTGDRCRAIQNGGFSTVERLYAFANPLKLNLQVDGVPAGMGVAQLATNAFSDVTFTIPGKFITKERSRIAFCGDHVAYAYWFYQ